VTLSTKLLFLSPIWGAVGVAAYAAGMIVGPGLEEQLAPILVEQSVASPSRTPDQACWRWRYHKARSATLMRKTMFAERADGVRFPVSEIRPDLGIPTNNSTSAPEGQTRVIPECVFIPEALRGRAFTVTGHNDYRPWHGMWELRQILEPVRFEADKVPGAAEPHDLAPVYHETADP